MTHETEMQSLSASRDGALREAREFATAGRWAESYTCYRRALGAHDGMIEKTPLQSERFGVLAGQTSLRPEAAYAAARAGDVRGAALILETGRARILGEAWVRDRLFGPELKRFDRDLAARYASAAAELAELERRERDIIGDAVPGEDTSQALARLRAEAETAHSALAGVIADARRFVDYKERRAAFAYEHIEAAAREGSALVYLAATSFGSFAVVGVAGNDGADAEVGYEVCWLDEFTSWHLMQPVSVLTPDLDIILWTVGSSLRAANALSQPERGGGWAEVVTQLENVLSYVGRNLMGPLARFLKAKGVTDVALVPYGELAQTPLHIAPFPHEADELSLIDLFDLRLIPSAAILEMCRRAAARGADSTGVCAVIRSPDLRGGACEALHLESLWTPAEFQEVTGDSLGPDAVREALRGASYALLSCHGYFQYWDQLSSGFVADGKTLFDLRDMLNEELLPACRLALAPACQSAFEDSPTTLDECVSLSLGLVCTGAAGVLGSQWNVHDLASALFVTRFNQELLSSEGGLQGARPWVVCSRVQRWLKNISAEELGRFAASVPALASLLSEYVEDYGPAALSNLYATSEVRREEAGLLATRDESNPDGRARERAVGDGARMRPWFWGAFVYVGA